MSESYSSYIKLILQDGVSSKMTMIAKETARTSNSVKGLNKNFLNMNNLMKGFMGYKAFSMAISAIKGATHAAMDYAQVMSQINMQGWDSVDITNAQNAAWNVSAHRPLTSPTENLQMVSDLRYTLGDVKKAIAFLPEVANLVTIFTASSASGDKVDPNEMARSVLRTAEMLGRSGSEEELNKITHGMALAGIVTGGRVKPEHFQQFAKYARSGSFALSDKFIFEEIPTMIQEWIGAGGMSRGGVGTFVQSVTRLAASQGMGKGGGINKDVKKAFAGLGLYSAKGIKDPELLRNSFIEWTWKYLTPIIEKKFGTDYSSLKSRSDVTAFVEKLTVGNQILGQGLLTAILKNPLIHKDMAFYGPLRNMADEQLADKAQENKATSFDRLGKSLSALGVACVNLGPVVYVIDNLAESISTIANAIHNGVDLTGVKDVGYKVLGEFSKHGMSYLMVDVASKLSSMATNSIKNKSSNITIQGDVYMDSDRVGKVLDSQQGKRNERINFSQSNGYDHEINLTNLSSFGYIG